MKIRCLTRWCLVAVLAIAGMGIGLERMFAAPTSVADTETGTVVLTRGPVHEAFAETVSFDPEAGVVVPRSPPEAIEELPPEQRPATADFAWIPGYWAWDDERADFLWVSGIWRDVPPGRQWVPGYWGPSGEGYQWTSGYWADAQASEIEYLPEPPQSVEAGPNIAAPSPDQTWLPGSWVWQQNRYAWRPGFWAGVQPNWSWVPSYYVWTPSGYVFVDGYWDYTLDRRGILFAPVYFDSGVYTRQGFAYSPTTVIDLGGLTNHLFVRAGYGHYYFGDYYGANYSTAGFAPWFSFHGRHGYDPFYAHQRWQHRENRDWDRHVEANYNQRRDHEEHRPPRTWKDQEERRGRGTASEKPDFAIAKSLDQLTKTPDSPVRFQPVDAQERQRIGQPGQELRKFRGERQKLEMKPVDTSANDSAKQPGPARVKLPRSPILGQPLDQLGKDRAPPQRHANPKPDLAIEAKPRRARGKPAAPAVTPGAKRSKAELETPAVIRKAVPKAPQKPVTVVPKAVPKVEPVDPPAVKKD